MLRVLRKLGGRYKKVISWGRLEKIKSMALQAHHIL